MPVWAWLPFGAGLCAALAQGVEPTQTPAVPAVHTRAPAGRTPPAGYGVDAEEEGDDYADVFYQFSPTRGFRAFIRTARGTEREITNEPGWQARHEGALKRRQRARREDYVRSHPELDPMMRNAITAGRLVRGMDTEQVRASVGDAVEESRTLTGEGLVEEWRYGIVLREGTGELPLLAGEDPCGEGRALRKGQLCILHFLDGTLSAWESSKE